MVINELNGKNMIPKCVYIHDDILGKMCFDNEEKILSLHILEPMRNSPKLRLNFHNVIGFEMTACDFWGKGQNIFGFSYVEENERILLPRLLKKKNLGNYLYSMPDDTIKYMETELLFASGDVLIVVCEYIIVEYSGKENVKPNIDDI